MNSRNQLTLFVPPSQAVEIERVRSVVDPIQFNLIAAHVTLAREDEFDLDGVEALKARLQASALGPLVLSFGAPQIFSGHGILLPCTAGEREFRALRQAVLGVASVRHQEPHITLAHPRNPRASGNTLAKVTAQAQQLTLSFTSICLIQQQDGAPWRVLERFPLSARVTRED
ncbi:MAG TPA: 2'-5' RNA ligase family protein [Burkholderiaceae bacterium]